MKKPRKIDPLAKLTDSMQVMGISKKKTTVKVNVKTYIRCYQRYEQIQSAFIRLNFAQTFPFRLHLIPMRHVYEQQPPTNVVDANKPAILFKFGNGVLYKVYLYIPGKAKLQFFSQSNYMVIPRSFSKYIQSYEVALKLFDMILGTWKCRFTNMVLLCDSKLLMGRNEPRVKRIAIDFTKTYRAGIVTCTILGKKGRMQFCKQPDTAAKLGAYLHAKEHRRLVPENLVIDRAKRQLFETLLENLPFTWFINYSNRRITLTGIGGNFCSDVKNELRKPENVDCILKNVGEADLSLAMDKLMM